MSDPGDPPDHFTRFGLPLAFVVDDTQLTDRYYDLQRSQHPDRFVNAPAATQQWATQQSALINQAFHILKDPLRRAEYLLTLHGIGCQEEQQPAHDTAFLLEQLELREALTMATDQVVIDQLATHVTALQRNHYQQLIHALETAAWEPASRWLSKLKFLAKLQQQVMQLASAPSLPSVEPCHGTITD